jgi:hypothetical protein
MSESRRSDSVASPDPSPRSVGTVVGLLLWRGGVYFVAGYLVFVGSRWIIALLLQVGIPAPVLASVSLIAGGILLVLVSLIVERVQDARKESGLKDMY